MSPYQRRRLAEGARRIMRMRNYYLVIPSETGAVDILDPDRRYVTTIDPTNVEENFHCIGNGRDPVDLFKEVIETGREKVIIWERGEKNEI